MCAQETSGTVGLHASVMAARPNSALLRCAVDSIVANVRRRYQHSSPNGLLYNPQNLSGSAMLMNCYRACIGNGECTAEDSPMPASATSVAIAYQDTRRAAWPCVSIPLVHTPRQAVSLHGLTSIEIGTPVSWVGIQSDARHCSPSKGQSFTCPTKRIGFFADKTFCSRVMGFIVETVPSYQI